MNSVINCYFIISKIKIIIAMIIIVTFCFLSRSHFTTNCVTIGRHLEDPEVIKLTSSNQQPSLYYLIAKNSLFCLAFCQMMHLEQRQERRRFLLVFIPDKEDSLTRPTTALCTRLNKLHALPPPLFYCL